MRAYFQLLQRASAKGFLPLGKIKAFSHCLCFFQAIFVVQQSQKSKKKIQKNQEISRNLKKKKIKKNYKNPTNKKINKKKSSKNLLIERPFSIERPTPRTTPASLLAYQLQCTLSKKRMCPGLKMGKVNKQAVKSIWKASKLRTSKQPVIRFAQLKV